MRWGWLLSCVRIHPTFSPDWKGWKLEVDSLGNRDLTGLTSSEAGWPDAQICLRLPWLCGAHGAPEHRSVTLLRAPAKPSQSPRATGSAHESREDTAYC